MWNEDIANFIMANLLVSCRTSSERTQLLKIIFESKFTSRHQHRSELDIGVDYHYVLLYTAIDYVHLYHINSVLSRTDICWDLSFTATLQFVIPSNTAQQLSLQDFYSVKVRIDSENVIETLMDKKEFSVAHDYAGLVGAGSDQISVKEVSDGGCC